MHIHRLALLVSSVLGLLYSQQGSAPAPGFEAPDLGYKLLPDWPNPPRNAAGSFEVWNLIQVASVAVDSRRRVLVLHRGAHPALEFDAAGKFLRSWGNGLISEGKVGLWLGTAVRPGPPVTRLSMAPRDAIPAARIRFAWIRRETPGWSTRRAT